MRLPQNKPGAQHFRSRLLPLASRRTALPAVIGMAASARFHSKVALIPFRRPRTAAVPRAGGGGMGKAVAHHPDGAQPVAIPLCTGPGRSAPRSGATGQPSMWQGLPWTPASRRAGLRVSEHGARGGDASSTCGGRRTTVACGSHQ